MKYIVVDANGIVLTNGNGMEFSKDITKAKTFETFGEAMKACIGVNVNAYNFRVKSYQPQT